MYALQHPRTRTVHTNRIYNFVLSLFEEGGTVVTPMHVWHVRTTTPTHSHSTHEPYLQLCTFYFWPYRILTLPYTHSLFITMFFILAFILIIRPRGTHLVPRHWWLPTWGLHGPCVLVDSARPAARRSSRTQPHALLDHNSTSLGPEPLARPRRRLHLATSNSLGHATSSPGHEHATRSATATRSLGLSNQPGLELNPTTLPIHLSRPRATRSVSDSAFSCKLTPTPQRYRKFGRELPATSNSTSARSSLVISGSASLTSSPHTWPTCLGQACRSCCLRVTAGTDHLNTLSLEFAKFVTLWEFSDNSSWFLTLQSQVLYGRFLNFRLFVSISHVLHIHLTFIFVLSTGFLSLFEEGGTVVTPMHVWHVRTTTPTHSHSTHEPYLQLCTFYFWPYRILTLPYTHSLFITMFFILAFISCFHSHYSASWHTHSPSTLVTPMHVWHVRTTVVPNVSEFRLSRFKASLA